MAEIIPAIIPKNFKDLEEKISLVSHKVATIHIDVTDSTLTPQSAWPYRDRSGEWEAIQREEEGLPYWEEVNFEAHLMVKEPDAIAEEWIRAGVSRIIVHAEVSKESIDAILDIAGSRDIEVGLAINFETPLAKALEHVGAINFIQLMSIDKIGAQGTPFNPKIFDRIDEIKRLYPEIVISVDGGVSLENADELIMAGVERLVVGSGIYKSEFPEEALEDFISISNT